MKYISNSAQDPWLSSQGPSATFRNTGSYRSAMEACGQMPLFPADPLSQALCFFSLVPALGHGPWGPVTGLIWAADTKGSDMTALIFFMDLSWSLKPTPFSPGSPRLPLANSSSQCLVQHDLRFQSFFGGSQLPEKAKQSGTRTALSLVSQLEVFILKS